VFQSSWCHGAPGIGLARLGILTAEDDPGVESEWAAAIETTGVADILPVDNLCCGNLGVCDILLTSAFGRNRPDLHASALKRASLVVHRAGEAGSFLLFAGVKESAFNPGFFQGTAGIGYELLRLARPTVLPSVLLFQTSSEIC
jgi:lantibiotic modifying enzyme